MSRKNPDRPRPRHELAEIELSASEHGEVLVGERPARDEDGHVAEWVTGLVYGEPATTDAQLDRIGAKRVGAEEADESDDEPF